MRLARSPFARRLTARKSPSLRWVARSWRPICAHASSAGSASRLCSAGFKAGVLGCFLGTQTQRAAFCSGGKPRKPGVATDDEIDSFLATHDKADIVVVDARNPDFAAEPGDARWGTDSTGPIAGMVAGARPRAVNLVWDRSENTMDLSGLDALLTKGKDTPIISHCGGGGRGQKARVFLEAAGFTQVLNGGGPEVPELWGKFGQL